MERGVTHRGEAKLWHGRDRDPFNECGKDRDYTPCCRAQGGGRMGEVEKESRAISISLQTPFCQ